MGYTTTFDGRFNLDKPLAPVHAAYLKSFAETRRMARDPNKAAHLPDPIRDAAQLPLGPSAAYFVGGAGMAGQDRDVSILDYNRAPAGQPGLWCKWEPTEDGRGIEWNGVEKFYDYVEWLRYLIGHFLKPWGYVLNGRVTWQGEEDDDLGAIVVKANEVTTSKGHVVYETSWEKVLKDGPV